MSDSASHSAMHQAHANHASCACSAFLPWALVGASWVAFALLSARMASGRPIWLDTTALRWLDATRSSWLTEVMRAVTHLGDGWTLGVLAVIVCCALWGAGCRRAALFVLCVSATVGLLDNGLKLVFARERPQIALRMVRASGFAFPSGHAMASSAIYAALAHVLCGPPRSWRRWAIPAAVLLTFVVGWSRVYLHVHYPTDVLGGWLLGLSWYVLLVQLML
jgi:membrane-associated phospholipid phosphatase